MGGPLGEADTPPNHGQSPRQAEPPLNRPLREADPEAGPGPAGSSRPTGRGILTSALTSERSTALSHPRES